MDPPTYSALAAPKHEPLAPADPVGPSTSPAGPSSAATAAAGPAAASGVSLLLTPLEGRSTFLSGRLLPHLPAWIDGGSSGTVAWKADGQPTGPEGSSAEVRGEVMTKGVRPERVEQLTVALKLALRRKGRPEELLFERSIVVFPPPPLTSSSMASSSTRPDVPADSLAALGRPTFNSSRQQFAIDISPTLPQCLHQPGLSLSYTLSAQLTLLPPPSTSTPPPFEVATESMEIHLCPSGRPSSHAAPLIRPLPAPGRTPTPVLVGFPKTRCRKSDPVRLWVEIPIPDQQALDRGAGLRNVRAELWRVVTTSSADTASSSLRAASAGALAVDQGSALDAALPLSRVAQTSSGLSNGSGSVSTLLTTTGSSCRFSPLSPIRLRLSVHAPLSPSSAYQLTCGHLTQHVAATGGKHIDVRFWVKVMVGFVGADIDEVDCEQEIVVLGDLDEAGDEPVSDSTSASASPAVNDSEGHALEPSIAPAAVEAARPFTKEKPYEGETYRQSDGAGPSFSASASYASPPGFVEALPSFSSSVLPCSTQHPPLSDPPPFSDFPRGITTTGANTSSSSSSRPPPFTAVSTLQDPSPPPPTFLESIPQIPQTELSQSTAPLGAVAEPDASLVPLLNLPPQVAPPTSPSADPANLPADWLEVDGYETFSLPAPSVSIGLEAEGSVDPPQEGEGSGVDRDRLEQIYDSIQPSALRASSSGGSSAADGSSHTSIVAMTREGSRVDDPNDLPPTFRDLALSPVTPSDDPPQFYQLAVERATTEIDQLPPHPSELRSEARRLARQPGPEVVPPPYAGDGLGSGSGVTRATERDEGGEEPPRYS